MLATARLVVVDDISFILLGRYLARELGASYYETSVYTFYGVEELFENAVRAALCSRWDLFMDKNIYNKYFYLF